MEKIWLFFECLFHWRRGMPDKAEAQKNVDAFFCQSFGPRQNSPGISNEFLAKRILEAYSDNPKPLIIQKDCADALPAEIVVDKIISKHEVAGKYLDSFEVSRQCFEYCREKNFKTLLIFSHPDHYWRVKKTVEKFGLIGIRANTNGMPYDWKSIQVWTKAALIFLPRELLARLYYLFGGKI